MWKFDKTKIVIAGSLVVSWLLYIVGVEFVLLGVCLAAGVCLLPPLAVMRSLVGRLFLSVFLLFGVFQVAATVQFFLLPSSEFAAPAAVTAAIYLIAVLVADLRETPVKERVAGFSDRHDAAAAVVAVLFLLPFTPVLIGDRTVARAAQIGGSQAIDATNHFAMIAELMTQQHWGHKVGNYYPKGFHITVAFIQDSLGISQTSGSWRETVFIFMGQYLVFGALVAGAIGYFLSGVFTALARRQTMKRSGLLLCAASIAVGVMAAPFLLWPFVAYGFLSYFYVITTALLAFVVLLSGSKDRLFSTIALYLVFVFGAGMSWPLLLPPLLATPALLLCQKSYLRALWGMPKRQLAGLVVLLGIQFIPVGLQLRYQGAGTGINATGYLSAFHPLSLLLTALIVVGIAASGRMERDSKERSMALLLPLLAFIGALALLQLFMVGEVRYYAIKSAFLLESMNFVFLACLVAVALNQMHIGAVVKFFAAVVVPAVVMASLLAVTGNPVTDVRNLWRTEANQQKPLFFDRDLELYAALGTAGEVDGFNTMVLHYDADRQKYMAHMQIAYWANMMQYSGDRDDLTGMSCSGELYEILAFGTATDKEQQDLVAGVKECAQRTEDRGEQFIILTDPASENVVRDEFGEVARVKTHEG